MVLKRPVNIQPPIRLLRHKRLGPAGGAHSQIVQVIGHDWLKDGQFGIKILQKNGS
jgi:hypothetical protein